MYRIAVDTGGTFTDAAVSDAQGDVFLGKALTTHGRLYEGVNGALTVIASQLGTRLDELISSASLFIYGTTHATNAILEHATAKTALLTTEGFRDILLFREGGRENPFNLRIPYPQPYIPRRLTYELKERVNAEGEIVDRLDVDHARQVLRGVKAGGVDAVAVCLLWSIANPTHEELVADLIEDELPGVPYTLSHRINPIIREYRRGSTAAIDASLKPVMQRHLTDMVADLRDAGFAGGFLAASSAGGMMPVEDLVERPVYAVRSGPSMAPVAARVFAAVEPELAATDLIVCDAGGTSFDVSLVRDGRAKTARETVLGGTFTGPMTGLASVDVRSIGAGGGSIAWVDSGGLLRAGPESAGASPGPACYGLGGDRPTVTDAAVVAGLIHPENFLGGRMQLDADRAHEVVSRLGSQLGLDPGGTARAILTIATEEMIGAITDITIKEGVDPRESLLVAGGGAAGLNVVEIARELGVRHVLLPSTASALSASGGLYGDIVHETSHSCMTHTSEFDVEAVNAALAAIRAELERFAERLSGSDVTDRRIDYFAEARYRYQHWELEVPLAKGSFDGPGDVTALAERFHDVHERTFAVREPEQEIECVQWTGRLTATIARAGLSSNGGRASQAPAPYTSTPAYFDEHGEVTLPRFSPEALLPGMVVDGPATIDDPGTTIVLYPQSTMRVTSHANYLIEVL